MRLARSGTFDSRLLQGFKHFTNAGFQRLQVRLTRRFWATQARDREKCDHEDPKDIAVIGGGITGLATAYFLSNAWPRSKITVLESSPRFGGWIRSSKVQVRGGHIIFEHGPRTLRPSGGPQSELTLQLIGKLGLAEDVISTPKDSPAAKNRFIFWPDHLVRMPGSDFSLRAFWSFLREPISKGFVWSILGEPFRPRNPKPGHDESIDAFFRRRFSQSMTDRIVSAVLHGIYAGDIYRLSAQALLPYLVWLEKSYGSLCKGALVMFWKRAVLRERIMRPDDHHLEENVRTTISEIEPQVAEKLESIRQSSVYTFKQGLEALPLRLVERLRATSNVTLENSTRLNYLHPASRSFSKVMVDSSHFMDGHWTPTQSNYDYVISTVPLKALNLPFLPQHLRSENNSKSDAVTVMVVNLFYSNSSLLCVRGFGYLIPRAAHNPEKALGVIFDSESTHGQDSIPGTKLTVMLGGHWWRDRSSFPNKEEGVRMAKAVLKKHLRVIEAPRAVNAMLQRECIPQYTKRHCQRMQRTHSMLAKYFRGGLRVAGSPYRGVSVNDCIRSAYETVRDLVSGDGLTGLEHYLEGNEYAAYPLRKERK